jgi:ribosomal protein L3 glutamine methyltransferase
LLARPHRIEFSKPPSGELLTLLDFVRYAVSRFAEASGVRAAPPIHSSRLRGLRMLHLHPDQFETFAAARSRHGAKTILRVIARRITSRKPMTI